MNESKSLKSSLANALDSEPFKGPPSEIDHMLQDLQMYVSDLMGNTDHKVMIIHEIQKKRNALKGN